MPVDAGGSVAYGELFVSGARIRPIRRAADRLTRRATDRLFAA